MKPGDLSIYVDESGSPDVLNRYGKDLLAAGQTSRYFVMAAVRCTDPAQLRAAVLSVIAEADRRFGSGIGKGAIRELHARDDRAAVRGLMCDALIALPIKALAIVMDKQNLDPARNWRTDRVAFYDEMTAYLLVDSLHLHQVTRIYFSHKNHDGQLALEATTKAISKRWAQVRSRKLAGKPVTQASAKYLKPGQEPCLQAVDYIAWAVLRAFERRDLAYYERLQPVLSDTWFLPTLTHYTRRRPMKNPP